MTPLAAICILNFATFSHRSFCTHGHYMIHICTFGQFILQGYDAIDLKCDLFLYFYRSRWPIFDSNSGQFMVQSTEYEHAATVADEAIAEAVARYIHEALLEKEERREGNEPA